MPTRRNNSAALCRLRGKFESCISSALGVTVMFAYWRVISRLISRVTSPSGS
eukprot:CAMPEP_0194419338 /NCGR_PEP_ID=MMETSP0176-20130528/18517_1 /TAXON_ID=216777 /ORGANISM="Proboscia alata, Strain PI-D3" /LENGTH=51 /DNA_ID=CAMNT_0039226269 /DNA_START=353 /DNA_END=505 /DNA_ORIENTATION=-